MKSRLFAKLILCVGVLFSARIAEATTLDPNSSSAATGSFSFNLFDSNSILQYTIQVNFGTGSYQTGSIAGGTLSSFQANLSGVTGGGLYSASGTLLQSITGGSLQYNANNLLQSGTNPGVYGLVEGQGTGGALVFNVTTSGGQVLTTPMNTNYMDMTGLVPSNNPFFPGTSAFDNTSIGAVFGEIGQGSALNAIVHGWLFNPTVTIPGLGTFSVGGDFTVRTAGSPVPEPATLGLMSLAMFGGAIRRRRSSKQ